MRRYNRGPSGPPGDPRVRFSCCPRAPRGGDVAGVRRPGGPAPAAISPKIVHGASSYGPGRPSTSSSAAAKLSFGMGYLQSVGARGGRPSPWRCAPVPPPKQPGGGTGARFARGSVAARSRLLQHVFARIQGLGGQALMSASAVDLVARIRGRSRLAASRLTPGIPPGPPGHILDVGCGSGIPAGPMAGCRR